jgi:hypothetical protein
LEQHAQLQTTTTTKRSYKLRSKGSSKRGELLERKIGDKTPSGSLTVVLEAPPEREQSNVPPYMTSVAL